MAQTYAELVESKKALRAQMQAEAKTCFSAGAADLFARFPELHAFTWRQYTPYFNDGDPCYFGLHGIDVNSDPTVDADDLPDVSAECEDAVSDFVEMFEDDDMEAMFGDHVRVTVKRDGSTTIDEYSHD